MSLQQVEVLLAGIIDTSCRPLSSGKVYTYAAGTSTNKTTYTDSAGATAAANPIVLDANGQAQIYAEGAYKFVIKDSGDNTLYTWDNLYFGRVTTATSQWPDIYGGTSGGAGATYTITAPLAITSYSAGQQFTFVANHTNTTTTTLNVNGIGAVNIVDGPTPSNIVAGRLQSGQLYSVLYDSAGGGRFRLLGDFYQVWTTWAPTYSANGAMTYTGVTTTFAGYIQLGKLVFIKIQASGTTGGVANNNIIASVPVACSAVNHWSGCVTQDGGGNLMGLCAINNGGINVAKSDSSNYGLGAGRLMGVTACYEAA